MRTDLATTELYFVFAYTYCKLSIYTDQEPFARKILEANDVEFLKPTDSEDWQGWDTRLLLAIVAETLPKILSEHLPQPKKVAQDFTEAVGIKS